MSEHDGAHTRDPAASSHPMRSLRTRILGVGLAGAIAAVTISLALTDRLSLYIDPATAGFAVVMSIIALVGIVATCLVPLGREEEHAHDHEHDEHQERPISLVATGTAGVLAAGVVGAIVMVPPASLSAEIAMTRDTGVAPLFQGADVVALAATGDTDSFGVGEWASVFATSTNPEAFDGEAITLTGFVTPGEGGFQLTRLVITHCVIDAQAASLPVTTASVPSTGQWVEVAGTVRDVDGRLVIEAAQVHPITEPKDPYEY